ncbi:MAG: ARMT1-like domain-containing protein [Syntrophomonadaceae bacterium]|nr:ARMT1-like domain-containing protein [Syntrophomonadaceae bacterium]MDD4561567.1 ARMT1-like domain-containing protein [Syntrophomonadaceae bacterium]
MRYSMECLPCLLNQGIRVARLYLENEEEQRTLLKSIIAEIAVMDHNASAPYIAHKVHRALKEALQNPDPYHKEKLYYNQEMLKLEDDFSRLVESADNPLDVALKLAAAGNIIDFGPGYDLTRDNVLKTIKDSMEKDYSQEVFLSLVAALQDADKLLYLGDNAGEIVFDKIFISTIKKSYPHLHIDFATRGEPIMNDVTEEDAYMVGIDAYATIINNGTDIPGTILEHCSDSFVNVFNKADVIIAKGQGNFESLYGNGYNNLYYIFLCKCDLFMDRFGARQKDLVLMQE